MGWGGEGSSLQPPSHQLQKVNAKKDPACLPSKDSYNFVVISLRLEMSAWTSCELAMSQSCFLASSVQRGQFGYLMLLYAVFHYLLFFHYLLSLHCCRRSLGQVLQSEFKKWMDNFVTELCLMWAQAKMQITAILQSTAASLCCSTTTLLCLVFAAVHICLNLACWHSPKTIRGSPVQRQNTSKSQSWSIITLK